MKTLLLIPFILLLFGSEAALTNFPGGPLESYKAYIRGECVATSTDCDLAPISSCWDDTSAKKYLNIIYQSFTEVANTSPQKSGAVLQAFFGRDLMEPFASVIDAINCEKSLRYKQMLFERFSKPEQGMQGVIANMMHYASVKPEDVFIMFKHMASLAEQGDFEAMGLLGGTIYSKAATLRKTEDSNWRQNAKNARQLLIKGLCESLGLNCPKTSALNCMKEESSRLDLESLYEWFKSVATRSKEEGAKHGVEFLLGRGKEILSRIPQSEIECDRNSVETKLINEKLGLDTWSPEWFETVIEFMKAFPDSTWHYKLAEYRLFENNDIEAVGAVMGVAWSQVAQWHRGRSGQETMTKELSEDAAMKKTRDSDWRHNAKSARQLLIKGLCESLGLDCPKTSSLNCMNEESSALDLESFYKGSKSVAARPKEEGARYAVEFLRGKGKEILSHIPQSEIECDRNSVETKLINEKLGLDTWSPKWFETVAEFMKAFPDSTWHYKLAEYHLFENNDIEAVGAVIGVAWSQVSQWHKGRLAQETMTKESNKDIDWRQDAKKARRLLIKGLCESLGLDCPETSSLNCMNEESSALDLESLYEWFKSVATKSKGTGARYGVTFLLGRGKEILSHISQSEIECDRNSVETKLINEKLGLDTWSSEWFEAVMEFMKQSPELTWHYKIAEYQLFENNDIEAVGAMMGLEWYQVGEWYRGRVAKQMTTEEL